jgi:hypothetical protein
MNNYKPLCADPESVRKAAAIAKTMRRAGLPVSSEKDAMDLEPEILDQYNAIMGHSNKE